MHRNANHAPTASPTKSLQRHARRDSFPIVFTAITCGSVQQVLSAVQTHDR